MLINVQDVLEELTVLLDAFFQGLKTCGLVSGYNVSLETSIEMLQPAKRCLPLLISLLCTLKDGLKELVLRHETDASHWPTSVTTSDQLKEAEKPQEKLDENSTTPSRSKTEAAIHEEVIEESQLHECTDQSEDVQTSSSNLLADNSERCENVECNPSSVAISNNQESNNLESTQLSVSSHSNQIEQESVVATCIKLETNDKIAEPHQKFFPTTDSNKTYECLEFSGKIDENCIHGKLEESKDVINNIWEEKTLENLQCSGANCEIIESTSTQSHHWEPDNDSKNGSLLICPNEESLELCARDETAFTVCVEKSATNCFQCTECQREFKSGSNLETHKAKAHSAPQCCDMCGQILRSTSALQEHCRTVHGGAGCFQCNICKKRFMLRLSFRRHLETHEPAAAMAVCEICGKSFRRADYLQRHYMMHSGQRPHRCSICGKAFVCASHLKNHQRAIHSEQRSHCCEMCGRGFSRPDKLKEHMLRHLNVKRYSCSICNREYAERRDLKKHQLRCLPTSSQKA